jgi:hypothetical protein
MNRAWILLCAGSVFACGTASLDLGPGNGSAPAPADGGTFADAAAATSDAATTADAPPVDTVGSQPTLAEKARAYGARWRWLTPVPTGEPMRGVAGTGMRDLWFVGDAGTVLRWNGSDWREIELPEPVDLEHAWAPRSGSIWTFGVDRRGRGRTFRVEYDGTVQEEGALTGSEVQAFASAGPDRMLVLGARGEVRLRDGAAWRTIREATGTWLRAVHAFSERDVWAVGDAGEIVHFDGTRWVGAGGSEGHGPFAPELRYEGIWGAAPNDLWAVAVERRRTAFGTTQDTPVFVHFDGTGWSIASAPSTVCGDTAPYRGNTGFWADRTEIPADLRRVDRRRPYGRVLTGIDPRNILFHAPHGCPFRYDGSQWIAEPRGWGAAGDGYYFSERAVGVVVYDASHLGSGNDYLDLSVAALVAPGRNQRWRQIRDEGRALDALTLDPGGRLWALDRQLPAAWTAGGFRPIGTTWARALFVRSKADIWIGVSSPVAGDVGLRRFDGSRWSDHALHSPEARATAIVGDERDVYVYTRRAGHRLLRFRDGAKLAEVEVGFPQEFLAEYDLNNAALLGPADVGDRVFLAYPVSAEGDPRPMSSCALISWDGRSAPRLEGRLPRCTAASSRAIRLYRLHDRRIALLTDRMLATWDGSSFTHQLEGIDGLAVASLGDDLHWLLTTTELRLWDARTNETAFVRKGSGLRTIVAGRGGESWAGGGGLLYFPPLEAPGSVR